MAKTTKKDITAHPLVAVLIIGALALGLVLGMTIINQKQQTASDAAGINMMDQSYDEIVRKAAQNNNTFGNGGALPNGFKQCYDDCRQGHGGVVCFFTCAR